MFLLHPFTSTDVAYRALTTNHLSIFIEDRNRVTFNPEVTAVVAKMSELNTNAVLTSVLLVDRILEGHHVVGVHQFERHPANPVLRLDSKESFELWRKVAYWAVDFSRPDDVGSSLDEAFKVGFNFAERKLGGHAIYRFGMR